MVVKGAGETVEFVVMETVDVAVFIEKFAEGPEGSSTNPFSFYDSCKSLFEKKSLFLFKRA